MELHDAVVPPGSTAVQVPVGDWFGTAPGYLTLSLGGIVAWAFRRLPGRISAILLTAQADQLMTRALGLRDQCRRRGDQGQGVAARGFRGDIEKAGLVVRRLEVVTVGVAVAGLVVVVLVLLW